MATYQAVAAVCEAVVRLLRTSYRAEEFDGNELEFEVYTGHDFQSPMESGVSLFLYRVIPNGVHRAPTGRNGQHTMLPVELHFLLTVWAPSASLEHAVAGWMMRTLEDTPSLPPGLLNATWPDVFRADEGVEIVFGELETETLMHMWEVLAAGGYHLSVPCVARVVRIESGLTPGDTPVRSRGFTVSGTGG